MHGPDFLSLQDITVRYLDKELFRNLSFKIKTGENWALVGESGSGKSALLNTIAGRFNIVDGVAEHGFYERYITEHSITDPFFNRHKLIALVQQKHNFRNLSNTKDFYYQQRYNSFDSEDALIVRAHLQNIPAAIEDPKWDFSRVVKAMHLEALLDKQVIKLSNGETRRLLFATALLRNPLLLLLDSPFTGLDAVTRAGYHQIIADIIASGIVVVMATTAAEIPGMINCVAVLKDGQIVETLSRQEFDQERIKVPEATAINEAELDDLVTESRLHNYPDIIKMRNVSVRYDDVFVLRSINWHVKQGECWALSGRNGAGKSTLLSLVNGDNPQAYSNDIMLFGRKRGSGESIWDIKKKIGFVSPEMLQYFTTDSTCIQVVESGFYDTMGLFRASRPAYAAIAMRWMGLMEIGRYSATPFKKLSASNQRLCLLARALAKNPVLLILDEPCQGLDQHQQKHFKDLLDLIHRLCNITMVYVTHYEEELPVCVNKFLKLEAGRIAGSGDHSV